MQAFKVKLSTMLKSEEFANQLCFLHEELPLEAIERDYVSKWLMTILTDEKTTTASIDEFPVIVKKIRDESLGERKDFFRRSNFYTSVKVILQHNLTMQFGAELGTFVYKIVMLKFLIQICELYKHPDCIEFNIDLVSQMIAKMARRIDKLHSRKPETITREITDFYNDTNREAKETIQAIREKIDAQIQLIQHSDDEMARLPPLNDLDFEADSLQNMHGLNEYLRKRAKMTTQHISSSCDLREIKSYSRYFQDQNRPFTEMINFLGKTDRSVFWIEFENMVLYELPLNDEQYTEMDIRTW